MASSVNHCMTRSERGKASWVRNCFSPLFEARSESLVNHLHLSDQPAAANILCTIYVSVSHHIRSHDSRYPRGTHTIAILCHCVDQKLELTMLALFDSLHPLYKNTASRITPTSYPPQSILVCETIETFPQVVQFVGPACLVGLGTRTCTRPCISSRGFLAFVLALALIFVLGLVLVVVV